ncbi:alpha/beta hydrolase [Roseateles cellulosilyticus]|uniref:Alpha/beta hydrolase n=1 Tax=Pelomonas cellulosilytica TaxID=2906762 RepID=A0ABS8XM51_9BURK|nr:alpha/beta hydrolase [Pelomonas sp. P8]MCE4552878.1 alpha/beta hydrolase [Pelomonas sp. P8]
MLIKRRFLVLMEAAALALSSSPTLSQPTATDASAACGAAVCALPARPVWTDGPPALPHWFGAAPQAGPDEVSADGTRVHNVSQPSYQPFLPAPGRATGAAVVVAPGGGFRELSIRSEGTDVARWLAERGVAAFVLRYRTIYQPPSESAEHYRQRVFTAMTTGPQGQIGEAAAVDGVQALREIRAHAKEFGIDPQRVGAVGFSAGGHVVGVMALAPEPADRPNFAGLIYGPPMVVPPTLPPAHLPYPPGTPKEPWLRPAPTPAPGALPPFFIAMAQDDVFVGTGVRGFYDTLFAADYRPELHLYSRGGHGFGMATRGTTSDHWAEDFHAWIEALGFKKASTTAP